ncbi:MAG: hypothetical protein HYY84_08090 [Deltaproteobacteria bacterium]|nr:hypothetical protein [Deltaproteobacteria bacterium]
MRLARPTKLYPAIVLQGMAFGGAVAGCGGTETGAVDPTSPPVFSWQNDAGVDAGGGAAVRDAGGGATRDAGIPTRDAGTLARDAGTATRDAGTPVHDAGTAHIDAGWQPTK